jgi:outer membrane protein assembly factor BamB
LSASGISSPLPREASCPSTVCKSPQNAESTCSARPLLSLLARIVPCIALPSFLVVLPEFCYFLGRAAYAADPTTGVVYAADPTTGTSYASDPSTGAVFASDAAGNVYASDPSTGVTYASDPSTGIVYAADASGNVCASDPSTGIMYAADSTGSMIYAADPRTGEIYGGDRRGRASRLIALG